MGGDINLKTTAHATVSPPLIFTMNLRLFIFLFISALPELFFLSLKTGSAPLNYVPVIFLSM